MDSKMGNPSDKRSSSSSAVQWCFCVFVLVMCGYSFVKQHRLEQRLRILEEHHFHLEQTVYKLHKPKEELLKRETRDAPECNCPSEIELLRRWKGLRGCFTRELKRQKMCEAGYDSGPRKSEYTHFKQMMFLCKVVYSKSMPSEYFSYEVPATTLTEVKKECSDGEGFEKVGENEESDDDESDPLIEIAKRNVKRPKYDMSSEDEDKLFLLSMLKTLQRIPVEKKISIKIKLMNVLDEATKDLGD